MLDPAAVLRREELRPTMLEGFKVHSKISQGATKDINTEPGDLSPEVPQTAQLSSVDYLITQMTEAMYPSAQQFLRQLPSRQKKHPGIANWL